jgi:hypothetical protein
MVEQATSWQSAPPAFPQADVSGVGVVSLATLDELRDARRTEQATADHMTWQAAELEGQAEAALADAGALLVPRRDLWRAPPELAPRMARAERLSRFISRLDGIMARLMGPPGPDGAPPPARIRASVAGRILPRLRAAAAARLRRGLVEIARGEGLAGVDVPDVEPHLEQAAELQARAETLRATLASVDARLSAMDREIRLREDTERHMGFDSVHVAAWFHLHGLPSVESPYEAEAGEVAHFSVGATMVQAPANFQRPGGQAPEVPVAYTGIRHWVGAFRDQAAPVQGRERSDVGTLVISNLRLAFVGRSESVGISLNGVVDVDIYTDAIAVFQLGRWQPTFFFVTAPRQVAFYLNWAVATGLVR